MKYKAKHGNIFIETGKEYETKLIMSPKYMEVVWRVYLPKNHKAFLYAGIYYQDMDFETFGYYFG